MLHVLPVNAQNNEEDSGYVTFDDGDSALPEINRLETIRDKILSTEQADQASREINAGPEMRQPVGQENSISPEEEARQLREQAFEGALSGLLPMKPEEIRRFLREHDKVQEAVETPHYPYPEPEVSVRTISLDPGQRPPEIKLATGHVTTVSILDVTGQPWPIQDVSWAGDFQIIEPEEGGHILRITPLAHYAYGNMSMRLLDLKTPVTFVLKTQRERVQYRLDIQIPEFGPYANTPIVSGTSSLQAGNNVLNLILEGRPPDNLQRLDVVGTDGRTTAFRLDDITFLRSPLTLLSPTWQSSAKSADGMNVYAMNNTPVVLLSDQGQLERVRLRERGQGS